MNLQNLKVSAFLATKTIQRGNKGTLILTIAITALVFVNLVFQPSILSGIVETFDRQAIDFDYGNLVIEPKDDETAIEGVESLTKKVNRIPGITGTSARIEAGATFTWKSKTLNRQVVSFTPSDEMTVTRIHEHIIEGEFLSDGDTDQIVLGALLAGETDETKDKLESLGGVGVGDTVLVTYNNGEVRSYRVKGIVETLSIGVDSVAYVTNREMASVLGTGDSASAVLVRIDEQGAEDEMKRTLQRFGVQEEIKTFREKAQGFIGDAVTSFNIINVISIVVSLIIAVVVIFIVVFINTVNKRKQIGILKAIGIDQRIIVNSYVMQVVFIGACGTLLGLFLIALITAYLSYAPLLFPGGPVVPKIEPSLIVRSVVSLFAVSIAAGYIPAWKTARENILDAIRGGA
jgi:putative ABC transport system permease protein